jgi:hypothetical protein
MNPYIIPVVLIVALVITLVFSIFSKRRLRGLWLFFLLLFLSTWAGQIWIPPFGPRAIGIAWVPLLAVALFFSLFIIALVPSVPEKTDQTEKKEDGAFIAIGTFFWILLLILVISIVVGYYRAPYSITV